MDAALRRDNQLGPLYLTRFVEERTVSTDTTAAGGNATLLGRVG